MSDFITVAELRIEAERLCDENERLEAENAELRNDADLLRAMLSQERLEKQCYMAENAKLRELVSGLEHCCQGFDCDCCPLYDPSGTNHRRCESLERELGIEVDE